jgi:TolA-binding protein/cytochrome c556
MLAAAWPALGAESVAPRPQQGAHPQQSRRQRFVPDGAAAAPQDLQHQIDALNLILTTQRGDAARTKLMVNRAALTNLMVRQRILASPGGKLDAEGHALLERSLSECLSVVSNPHADAALRLKAREVAAYSCIYLDRSKEAKEHFVEVLKADPKSKAAGGMALFVAEELFEEQRFPDAIVYYSKFFPAMTPEQRAIATYKLAWSNLNIGKAEDARKMLIQLAKGKGGTQMSKDSLRDLAYLATLSLDYRQIEQISGQMADQRALELEFLRLVQASLEAQNAAALHGQVVSRLLVIEQDPQKRLRFLIADLKVNHANYAARSYLAAFDRLREFAKKESLGPASPAVTANAALLEQELHALMRSMIDTYGGKVPSPEAIPARALGEALVGEVDFTLAILPASKLVPTLVGLGLDLALDLSDWPRIDSVAEKIRADAVHYPKIQEKAAIGQLAALTELSKKDPQGSYSSRREARLKEFTAKYSQSPQWLRIAKSYAEVISTTQDPVKKNESLAVLNAIFEHEKNADNLYRSLLASYGLGKYAEVIGDSRDKAIGGAVDPRIGALKCESALKLAEAAKAAKQLGAYRDNIRYFVSQQHDPAKIAAARQDYFSTLSAWGKPDELVSELAILPMKERTNDRYSGYVGEAWTHEMSRTRFLEALSLVKDDPKRSLETLLARLASGTVPAVSELNRIAEDKRAYVQGIVLLAHPDTIVQYFSAFRPRSDAERDLAALAFRLREGKWGIERSAAAERVLGKSFSYERPKSFPLLPLESKIAGVQMNPKKATAVFAAIRKIRGEVPRVIQGKDPVVQLRVTRAAQELERKTADFVQHSPLPPGLGPAQVQQYNDALKEAAREFTAQSEEFGKIAEKVASELHQEEERSRAGLLPQPDLGRWPWPGQLDSDPKLSGIRQALARKNPIGALILADLLRSETLPKDAEYFTVRTGLILSLPVNESVRRYLYSELEHSGRSDVIGIWKGLVHP